MSTTDYPASRRKFLKLGGTGLALIPLANLVGCSDESGQTPAAQQPAQKSAASESTPAKPAPSEAAGSMEPAAQASAPAPTAALTKLDESEPTAIALGYRHDATQVDTTKFPRYQAGQHCASCMLFQPDVGGEAGWGACSIFPGKLVDANGWCSAFVAKT